MNDNDDNGIDYDGDSGNRDCCDRVVILVITIPRRIIITIVIMIIIIIILISIICMIIKIRRTKKMRIVITINYENDMGQISEDVRRLNTVM